LAVQAFSPLSGDFNGDGLTDIAVFNKSTGEVRVAFSTTRGFVASSKNPWVANYGANQDLFTADFNNDGLTDIGYFDKSGDCKWHQALNTSTGFTDNGIWLDNFGSSGITSVQTGDFNSDGLMDAATFDKAQKRK